MLCDRAKSSFKNEGLLLLGLLPAPSYSMGMVCDALVGNKVGAVDKWDDAWPNCKEFLLRPLPKRWMFL